MELRYDTVTFMSDYGTVDEFVGVVHSVIRSIAPEVAVIDLTHQVPPYDVRAGALTLARSAQYLRAGVVVAVVDPGVGGERRAIAVEVGEGQSVLIGPDNGLLAPAVAMVGGATRAFALTNTTYHLAAPGPTFDGRDIFAPVAAHLCTGVPLEELGTEIDPNTLRPSTIPIAQLDGDVLLAEALWVDQFGNVQLNVDPDEIADMGDMITISVTANGRRRSAPRIETFSGLGVGAGDEVSLEATGDDPAQRSDDGGLSMAVNLRIRDRSS